MDDALMTVEDLADYLGIPAATIYAWNSRRTGPPRIRIGKYVRYRRGDVEAWLDSKVVDDAPTWLTPTRRAAR